MSAAMTPPWYSLPSFVRCSENGTRSSTSSVVHRSTTTPRPLMKFVPTMILRNRSRHSVCSSSVSAIGRERRLGDDERVNEHVLHEQIVEAVDAQRQGAHQ